MAHIGHPKIHTTKAKLTAPQDIYTYIFLIAHHSHLATPQPLFSHSPFPTRLKFAEPGPCCSQWRLLGFLELDDLTEFPLRNISSFFLRSPEQRLSQ